MTDTSPAAQAVLDAIYRDMSPARKWRMFDEMFRLARNMHAAGVRMDRPDATDSEIHEAWLEKILEPELFEAVRERIHATRRE